MSEIFILIREFLFICPQKWLMEATNLCPQLILEVLCTTFFMGQVDCLRDKTQTLSIFVFRLYQMDEPSGVCLEDPNTKAWMPVGLGFGYFWLFVFILGFWYVHIFVFLAWKGYLQGFWIFRKGTRMVYLWSLSTGISWDLFVEIFTKVFVTKGRVFSP